MNRKLFSWIIPLAMWCITAQITGLHTQAFLWTNKLLPSSSVKNVTNTGAFYRTNNVPPGLHTGHSLDASESPRKRILKKCNSCDWYEEAPSPAPFPLPPPDPHRWTLMATVQCISPKVIVFRHTLTLMSQAAEALSSTLNDTFLKFKPLNSAWTRIKSARPATLNTYLPGRAGGGGGEAATNDTTKLFLFLLSRPMSNET